MIEMSSGQPGESKPGQKKKIVRPIHAQYVCSSCRQESSTDTAIWRCACGESHLRLTTGTGFRRADVNSAASGIWRYAKALPVDPAPQIYLGEGCTPLVSSTWEGSRVYFKLDFQMPTGSFKDRGSAVMATHLLQRGVRALVEDSSGNAGASIAAYCAASGIACSIFVPASASPAKIVQTQAVGAHVIQIAGTRGEVTKAAMLASEDQFYASHNRQPFFVEGLKTLAFELWENFAFDLPDNVVLPLGGGSNLLGCHLGFQQLLDGGEIDRLPKLFGIQAAQCAPIHAAWVNGNSDIDELSRAGTSMAEGVMVTTPVRGADVLLAVRQSGGSVTAVEENDIAQSMLGLARVGLFVEPTAALAVAGLSRLLAEGLISRDARTVVVLTGTGLKSTDVIAGLLERIHTN